MAEPTIPAPTTVALTCFREGPVDINHPWDVWNLSTIIPSLACKPQGFGRIRPSEGDCRLTRNTEQEAGTFSGLLPGFYLGPFFSLSMVSACQIGVVASHLVRKDFDEVLHSLTKELAL